DEIVGLQQELNQRFYEFILTATGINLDSLVKTQIPAPPDLSGEVSQILAPLFTGIRSFTQRPREISTLRDELMSLERRLKDAKRISEELKSKAAEKEFQKLSPILHRTMNIT